MSSSYELLEGNNAGPRQLRLLEKYQGQKSSRPLKFLPHWVAHPPRKASFPIILTCCCACVYLKAVDAVVFPVLTPTITNDFHASSSDTYWCGSIYLLGAAVSQPILSGLAKAWSRQALMQLALTIFTAGSVLCAVAGSISVMQGGRLVRPTTRNDNPWCKSDKF